ncbi:MAG: hypothetical protein HY885_10275 [Deltaproteobacteria bacterium]|nr:hypothetical protein [Deltaproteobacteria bacterium]
MLKPRTMRMEAGTLWPPAWVAAAFFFVLLLFHQGYARAAMKQFVPRYVDFSSEMGIGGLYEKDEVEARRSSTRQDYLLQEGVSVKGLGYIYSPLFVSLATTLGLGLKQEEMRNSGGRDESFSGWAHNFKQEFKILPSHPYNAELYFLRATPMTAGNPGDSSAVIIYEQGALARYDARPWSTSLTMTNRETDAIAPSDFETLLYNLHYYITGFNGQGAYNHTTSSNQGGLNNTTRDLYSLGMVKAFGEKIRFTNRWSYDEQDEDNKFNPEVINTSLLTMEEFASELAVELPRNFDTSLSYHNTDRSSDHQRETRISESFSKGERYNFYLHHRLFSSLSSSFGAGYSTTDAVGGTMDQQNYRLTCDYSKKIPWGSVLAGVWDGLSFTDNKGAPSTLFETHPITTGLNFFTINYQTIDLTTLQVRIIDSNNNNRQVLLIEGINYIVTPFPNSYRITITSLPYEELEDPDGNIWEYTYQADYAFLPADYLLQAKTWGSSLQLPLYNNLINPHYSYMQTDQSVLEGNYPGEPAASRIHTFGVSFSKFPFAGDVTQSWIRSNTTDEDRLTTYLSYTREINTYTSGFLTCSFEDAQTTQYELLKDAPEENLSEQFYTAQAQLQTVLPEKNMNASLGSNYTLYQGVGESTNLSLFSTFVWHVGKIDLDLSASYTTSDSSIADSNTTRSYTMVRFNVKRELF